MYLLNREFREFEESDRNEEADCDPQAKSIQNKLDSSREMHEYQSEIQHVALVLRAERFTKFKRPRIS